MSADILLTVDNLTGEAGDAEIEDAMRLSSWQIGIGRGISSGAGRETSTASVSEIVATCSIDRMVQDIAILASANGKVKPRDAKIYQRRSGGATEGELAILIELKEVLFSGVSYSASEGGLPSCSISLNFTEITMTYFPQKSDSGAQQAAYPWWWSAEDTVT